MRNAGLEEAQAGIKIAMRNINNLNMQMKPPLWQKVKRTKNPLDERETGEWKTCLKTQHSKKIKIKKIKLNIQKTKIMASSPITSW